MEGKEQTRIVVRVQPNASQNEVLRFQDSVLYIKIAASPVKGRANQELIKFLSSIMGVGKSSLTIEKGVTAKRKVMSIDGLTQGQVMEKLESLVG